MMVQNNGIIFFSIIQLEDQTIGRIKMSRAFQIIEEKEEINKLVEIYFSFINGKDLEQALKCFAKKKGYGEEIVFVFFRYDFDEYDRTQLPKPLDENHVLVELGYPAVEVEQIAYLDFKTFYDYLDENVKKELNENPDKTELIDLLAEVKYKWDI